MAKLAAFSPSDSTYTDSGLKNKVRQIRVVFKGTVQRDFLIQVVPHSASSQPLISISLVNLLSIRPICLLFS
jgi:hypothetical protein